MIQLYIYLSMFVHLSKCFHENYIILLLFAEKVVSFSKILIWFKVQCINVCEMSVPNEFSCSRKIT